MTKSTIGEPGDDDNGFIGFPNYNMALSSSERN